MRFATVITLYKKINRCTENAIVTSVLVAYSEDDAITKAIQSESVALMLADDYKMFWKKAMYIPELNIKTGKYE